MSDFMQHEITRKQDWWQGESQHGGAVWVPRYNFTAKQFAEGCLGYDAEELEGYSDAELAATGIMTTVEGYGARLSAPGYMDCTEWCVFATEKEAREYLAEMYDDDCDTE